MPDVGKRARHDGGEILEPVFLLASLMVRLDVLALVAHWLPAGHCGLVT